MSDDHSYNGWENYETWAVVLWIDNEEGSYSEARRLVQESIEQARKDLQTLPGYRAAETLKEWVQDMAPDLGATLWADLLGAALSEVDWYEIVNHYLEE